MHFILDENYSHRLAEGLHLLEQGNTKSSIQVTVSHISALAKRGTSDQEVIKVAGKHGAVVITQDSDFKRIKLYYQLYKEHNVGVVFYKSYKDKLNYWGLVTSFIDHWEELKKEVLKQTAPFALQINNKGIQRMEF